ncbi:MAG TPA: acylphosphatase [Nitrospiraceae bacterium]|nr:acylphosphatase [Nitrospiraceae bacterium]
MDSDRARACIWISGRVQGVAYRAFAQQEALQHALDGGVRNLDDGRVAVEVEGEKGAIDALIARLRAGPRMARVDHLEIRWEPPRNQDAGFHIWT